MCRISSINAKIVIILGEVIILNFIIWLRQITHADWLISGLEKAILPLKKVILPSQEIHLARSCKHCTNKFLKEIKTYHAV